MCVSVFESPGAAGEAAGIREAYPRDDRHLGGETQEDRGDRTGTLNTHTHSAFFIEIKSQSVIKSFLQERQKQLESMGISLESSGIKVGEDKCFLVNLNADPALNELLVYYLKVQ